jgi:hypothetical protein
MAVQIKHMKFATLTHNQMNALKLFVTAGILELQLHLIEDWNYVMENILHVKMPMM